MGWGLTINGMYLSRHRKSDLETDKETSKSFIDSLKNELVALVSYTNPTYHDGPETYSLPEWAVRRVPEIVNDLQDEFYRLHLIEHAIDNPEDIVADE